MTKLTVAALQLAFTDDTAANISAVSELVREMTVGGKRFVPNAVGALLPPGYTRTFLPGEVKGEGGPADAVRARG